MYLPVVPSPRTNNICLCLISSGDYQDGEKIGFSMYLGEYFNLRFSLDGGVMQEDKRYLWEQVFQQKKT